MSKNKRQVIGSIDSSNEISESEIAATLARSGYLLEYRIEEHFRKKQYNVQTSSAFLDPHTGKSREVDLVAQTAARICHPRNKERMIALVVAKLIIECENNSQPVCFFMKPRGSRSGSIIKRAAQPEYIKEGNCFVPILDAFKVPQVHHYSENRIATQYCTFQWKRDGDGQNNWIANHFQSDLDTFQRICDEVDYFHNLELQHYREVRRENMPCYLVLIYPILVLGGKMFETEPIGPHLNLKPTEHVQFFRRRVKPDEAYEYNIDVITESYLPKMIHLIDTELKEIAKKISESDAKLLLDNLTLSETV